MFTTKVYLIHVVSIYILFFHNNSVKKARQIRSFKILVTRTKQEIAKQKKKKQAQKSKSKVKLFIQQKTLNYVVTGSTSSVRQKSTREIAKNACSEQNISTARH